MNIPKFKIWDKVAHTWDAVNITYFTIFSIKKNHIPKNDWNWVKERISYRYNSDKNLCSRYGQDEIRYCTKEEERIYFN